MRKDEFPAIKSISNSGPSTDNEQPLDLDSMLGLALTDINTPLREDAFEKQRPRAATIHPPTRSDRCPTAAGADGTIPLDRQGREGDHPRRRGARRRPARQEQDGHGE